MSTTTRAFHLMGGLYDGWRGEFTDTGQPSTTWGMPTEIPWRTYVRQLTLGDEVVFTYDAQESMAELVRQGRPGPVAHDLAFGDGLAPKPGEAKAGTDEVTVERDGAEWVMRLYGDEVARCPGDRISSRDEAREWVAGGLGLEVA